MCTTIDKTALAVVKALRASALKAQKISVGFQLSVQLSTGIFFDVGKLETVSKALRLNVLPMVATALPNANIITRLDNVAYIVQENGVSVVKHGSIDIVDNGATALPRVASGAGSLFGKNAISGINGFSDNVASILSQQGLSLDDFKVLQQKRYDPLIMSLDEIAHIDAIRNSIPMPNGTTVLQKVIPKNDIVKYTSGQYTQIGGFVSTAKDAKHLNTFDDIYYGMRLDYTSNGIQPFSLSDGSCGVIRYKTSNPNLTVPKPPTETGVLPYTGNGFTGGNNGRLCVPEWKSPYNTPQDGAELWEVFSDGSEILRARFLATQNKFIPIQ